MQCTPPARRGVQVHPATGGSRLPRSHTCTNTVHLPAGLDSSRGGHAQQRVDPQSATTAASARKQPETASVGTEFGPCHGGLAAAAVAHVHEHPWSKGSRAHPSNIGRHGSPKSLGRKSKSSVSWEQEGGAPRRAARSHRGLRRDIRARVRRAASAREGPCRRGNFKEREAPQIGRSCEGVRPESSKVTEGRWWAPSRGCPARGRRTGRRSAPGSGRV